MNTILEYGVSLFWLMAYYYYYLFLFNRPIFPELLQDTSVSSKVNLLEHILQMLFMLPNQQCIKAVNGISYILVLCNVYVCLPKILAVNEMKYT